MSAPCWYTSLAIGLVWLLAAPAAALAHGDLHEQIAAVTQRIEAEPGNAELRLRRGELHRLHGAWRAARTDYDKAANLDPKLDAVEFARCRLWFDSGDWEKARASLNRFLARTPTHADALAMRARVLAKLGHPAAAADDFARAIQSSASAGPELYIERASTLASCGSKRVDAALQSLDEGIAKFGPLVTLELPAIELEMRRTRYNDALARLEKAAARSPRKESWLARRGEILECAGRPAEARAAFTAALAAINSLPPHTRNTKAVTELTARVRISLGQMNSRDGANAHRKLPGK